MKINKLVQCNARNNIVGVGRHVICYRSYTNVMLFVTVHTPMSRYRLITLSVTT